MSEGQRTTIRISQAAARFVQPGATREEKIAAARGEADIPSRDIPLVQFCLSRDSDTEIREAAIDGLRRMPEQMLFELAASPETHPLFLALIAGLHGENPEVAGRIASNPSAQGIVKKMPAGTGTEKGGETESVTESDPPAVPVEQATKNEQEEDGSGDEQVEEEGDTLRSTFQLAKEMSISEKIKMAMTGDKEWRMLLIKDSNKLISGAVIKNPRITEAEVLTISKARLNNDDILREICINKDWIKNYQIKKSLVENNKTPLQFALKFLSSLTEKDLGVIAKSKNVSSVISTQARRLLMNKQKDK